MVQSRLADLNFPFVCHRTDCNRAGVSVSAVSADDESCQPGGDGSLTRRRDGAILELKRVMIHGRDI